MSLGSLVLGLILGFACGTGLMMLYLNQVKAIMEELHGKYERLISVISEWQKKP
jgi:hypothetical protein